VLGEHFRGREHIARSHLANRDDSLSLAKKVWKNAQVNYWDARPSIRDAKPGYGMPLVIDLPEATLLNESTKTNNLTLPGCLSNQVRGRFEKYEVASERNQSQRSGAAQPNSTGQDKPEAPAFSGHDPDPRLRNRKSRESSVAKRAFAPASRVQAPTASPSGMKTPTR
jgi:hypothetical protein